MSQELNSPEIIEKFKEILKSNGILDKVAEILVENPSLKGQGVASAQRYVTVKFENLEIAPLHLFSKVFVAGNASQTEMLQGVQAFEREAVFLTKYMEAAKELLNQKGLSKDIFLDIYPKCYYGDEEMLVLENLVLGQNKYQVVGLDKRHNWDVAVMVLQSLAKFHALTHAMIMVHGGISKFAEKFAPVGYDGFSKPQWASTMQPWMSGACAANCKLLEIYSDVEGAPKALELQNALETRKNTIWELWHSCILPDETNFNILSHGDAWFTNMMFIEDQMTGKFVRPKIFDFQFMRYNSPVIDLGYYLFTSVETSVRQTRLSELLQVYLNAFKELCSQLGYPVADQQLSYQSLLLEFKKRFYYGLIHSFVAQYGVTRKVIQETDMTQYGFDQWGSVIANLTEKWIAKNPQEARILAKELVLVLEEAAHLQLSE